MQPGHIWDPIINEELVDILYKPDVSVVYGIRCIRPSGEIELSNGDIISDVDTIILCSGYQYDYSLLPEAVNPIKAMPKAWREAESAGGQQLVRLYQGTYSRSESPLFRN